MARLSLTLACWRYDRTRALAEGRIQPDGIDLTYLSLPVEETFFRMLRHREFDAAEMSLSSYVLSLFAFAEPPFVAIPIFPSRAFRHSSIYVHTGRVSRPEDLAGKRVGTPEYQMTAGVWIRGMLADEYHVDVRSITYYTGGEEEPGRPEKLALNLPPERGIRVERIGPTQTLARMLEDGEIDALYTARAPSPFMAGSPNVRRLFDDYQVVEGDYYRRTGLFPIMHTVVMRRALYERHPWMAQSLYKAFVAAQSQAYDDLRETVALTAMLPWLVSHVEATRALMGDDYWPYGYAANQETLATFLRYSYDQGLAGRLLEPAELFAPETLESFAI